MSEVSPANQIIPTFLAPHAAEAAFIGGYILEPDIAAIDGIAAIVAKHDQSFGLPKTDDQRIAASELTLIVRGGKSTLAPHKWDVAWENAHTTDVYYSCEQVRQPDIRSMRGTGQPDILAMRCPIVELTVTDFAKPIGVILAAKLVGATPTSSENPMRTLSTMMSGNLWRAAKQVKAMDAVEQSGLEPFKITRKPGYNN